MPAWSAISLTTLESHACAPLLEACRTAATDVVMDRFPQLRDNVVQRVRMAVASGKYALESDTAKVPPELVSTACWLIIEQLVAAMPYGVAFTQDQTNLLRREWEQLNAVRDGKLAVTEPATPADPSGAQVAIAPVQIVCAPTRRFTREKLSGL